FRSWLPLASSRITPSLTNAIGRNLGSEPLLEEALRHFDFVAGLQFWIEARVLPDLPHIINLGFASTKKADPFLIREIVKSAGGADRSQQRHIFCKRNAGGCAHRSANIHETRLRLHHDRDR